MWVAYGMGNVLSNLPTSDRWPASSQDAALAEFTVSIADDGTVSGGAPVVTATWVDKLDGWVIRDVVGHLADPETPDSARARYTASFMRTASVLAAAVVRSCTWDGS